MAENSKLESRIAEIAELGKENKNVDVAALLTSALESTDKNMVPASSRRMAYIACLAVPPLGVLIGIKYYWLDEHEDAKQVAAVCILLAIFGFLLFIVFSNLILDSSGLKPEDIEQLNPAEVIQSIQ